MRRICSGITNRSHFVIWTYYAFCDIVSCYKEVRIYVNAVTEIQYHINQKMTVSLGVISEMRSFCDTGEGGVIWATYWKSSGTGI